MNREQFELSTLKVDKEGRVNFAWRDIIKEGDAIYADKKVLESPRICHPDLKDALENLQDTLAEANGLYSHRRLQTMEPALREFMEDKKGQRILKKLDDIVCDSVKVSGISMGGDLETGWCVITGKHEVHNTAVAMNSPKISFGGEAFGFEDSLKSLVEILIDEAFEYVFNAKGAQQTIPFQEEAEEVGEAETV